MQTIPKCSGSIPKDAMTGIKIGTRITRAARLSITIPTKSKKILITRRAMNLFVTTLRNTAASLPGICCAVIMYPNALAQLTIKSTLIALVRVSSMIPGRSFHFRSRVKKPWRSAYNTATTEASVGVQIPVMIPPKIIIGVSSAGKDVTKDLLKSRNPPKGVRGYSRFLAAIYTYIICTTARQHPGKIPAINIFPTDTPLATQ